MNNFTEVQNKMAKLNRFLHENQHRFAELAVKAVGSFPEQLKQILSSEEQQMLLDYENLKKDFDEAISAKQPPQNSYNFLKIFCHMLHLHSGERVRDFSMQIEKIRSFSNLPENWDGYHSPPINRATVENALNLVEFFSRLPRDWQLDWVSPTSDETILMQFSLHSITVKVELDSDPEYGIMVKKPGSEPEFHDLNFTGFCLLIHSLSQ